MAPAKPTTIRAALGLIKLDAGEVHLLGQRCDANAPDEAQRHLRSRIGLVLDTCPFPSTLKVGQVERLVGPAYPTWSCETFAGFIDRFGLDTKAKVKDLSRGMGMKLQLACALSHHAKLLVLDEATAGLDPKAPAPPTTPTAWTCSCLTVARRSRPSPRFPAIGQPLMTIFASR